jgi:hypothetical protein
MRRILPAVVLTFVAMPAAQASFFGPVYLDAGYQHQLELPDEPDELEGQGYDLGLSLDLGEYLFVGAGYSSVRTEPFDDGERTGRLEYRSIAGSLGGYLPITERFGTSASVGYTFASTHGLDGFDDDPVERSEGLTGSLGLHYDLMRWVDVSVGAGYSYIGGERAWDASTGLSLLAFRGIWLDTSYWMADDMQGWTAGIRAHVGR